MSPKRFCGNCHMYKNTFFILQIYEILFTVQNLFYETK